MSKTWFDMTPEERKQTLIDERKAKVDAQAAFIADLPAAREREIAAKAASSKAEAEQVEQQFRASVRASYIASNGSDSGFDSQWPTLRAEIVKQRAIAHIGDQARNGDAVDRWLAKQAAMPQPTNPLLQQEQPTK